MDLPINLFDTGCITSVTVSETINGNLVNRTINNVASINCVPYIIQNVIFWLLLFAGTVAVILIIFSGIKFITSGGDPKQTEGARKTLTFTLAGLILILLSFAILRFIAQTTGVGCITRFGFRQCTYTPKGVSGSRKEINCDPDRHIKVCEGANLCYCVDKPQTGDERKSCSDSGGICMDDCKVAGTGLAKPQGGWSDCSSTQFCCDKEENR